MGKCINIWIFDDGQSMNYESGILSVSVQGQNLFLSLDSCMLMESPLCVVNVILFYFILWCLHF